jgi:hypothetical protein
MKRIWRKSKCPLKCELHIERIKKRKWVSIYDSLVSFSMSNSLPETGIIFELANFHHLNHWFRWDFAFLIEKRCNHVVSYKWKQLKRILWDDLRYLNH